MKLEITKEKVLKASEKCPDAKVVLKELFPDVFEGKWEDITKDIKWKVDGDIDEGGALHGYYDGKILLTASSLRFSISPMSCEDGLGRFLIKHNADSHTVLKRD